jgi:glycine cleavage system H protein
VPTANDERAPAGLGDLAPPCIWMSAGLLTYKLCDREYDCERCPLDAALRGESLLPERGPEPVRAAVGFPADRLYAPGHAWLQRRDGGEVVRLGLDGFAAVLLGRPLEVRFPEIGSHLEPGAPACEVGLAAGTLALSAPFPARVLRGNQRLARDADLVASSPYDDGWLLELEPLAPRSTALAPGLTSSAAARERAALDLRRFRRQAAFHLLADSAELGPTLQDGGTPLTDLRRILGRRAYLELLREFVH